MTVCICEEARSRGEKFWFCPRHGPQHHSKESDSTRHEPSRERLEILRDRRIRRIR